MEYPSQELMGRVLWEVFVRPEARALARARFNAALLGQDGAAMESEWINKSGAVRRLVFSQAVVRGEDRAGPWVITTGIEVSARERAPREHAQSEAHFRIIWNALPEPMCRHDAQGCIREVNQAFARMARKPEAALEGVYLASLFGRDHEAKLKTYLETGAEHPGSVIIVSPDEQTVRYELVILPLEISAHPAQFLSVFRDVSEREAHAAELSRARAVAADTSNDLMAANLYLEETGALARELAEDAAALRKAKSDFLSNMTHEFRTPLNGILGMLELAADDAERPQQCEYLELARQSANALLDLANDVLDYARYEAGKLALAAEEFSLERLLQQTLGPLAERAAAKHLPLEWLLEGDAGDVLMGDAARLSQVLAKLVSNAIKFTAEGQIVVRARVTAIRQSSAELYFTVSDTGIGIPREKQSAIFQPFTQADGSSTRPYGGAGLGLSIASLLVELMGGRIWLESEPGRGTAFHFTVVVEAPGVRKKTERSKHARSNQRILVAEDNIVNQRLAARLLEREGHQVEIAASGRQVLELLSQKRFDLVLMDLQMPEMDGLEAAAHIRRKERGSGQRIPIVAVTAQASESDRQRCFEAGMDAYVTKPVRVPELMSMIESVIPGGSCMNVDTTQAAEQQLRQLDEAVALSRVGGDRGLLREVVELFLDDYPGVLDKIRAAVSSRDANALEHHAHSLKGSVSTFGAQGAFDAALALERKGRSGDLSGLEEGLGQLENALVTLRPELETLHTR